MKLKTNGKNIDTEIETDVCHVVWCTNSRTFSFFEFNSAFVAADHFFIYSQIEMDSDDEITRREFLDFCDENNLLTPTTDPAKKKQRVAASGIQHEVHKRLPASDDGSSIVIVQC